MNLRVLSACLLMSAMTTSLCRAQSSGNAILDAFYPDPTTVSVESVGGSVVRLEPYVSLNLKGLAGQIKWLVHKRPPVYVGQHSIKGEGAIIAMVSPPVESQQFNPRFEEIARKKLSAAFKTLKMSRLVPLKDRPQQFQMKCEVTLNERETSFMASRIVYTDAFCLQFQCVAKSKQRLLELTEILDSMKLLNETDE